MEQDLQQATALLNSGDYTCVICRAELCLTETARGVRPLLQLLEAGPDCRGASAADKVVGKAAAFLYCLLGIRALYARVLSQPALDVLEEAHIAVSYDRLVPAIRNRTDTGLCPMESAVWDLTDATQAPALLRATLEKLVKENT